ncbi:MAG: citrate synthase [Capsulimonadaceae bacterium]
MVAAAYRPGLEGVVAAQTRLSSVDGEAGELIIAGFPVAELAENATFEELTYLLWNDRLPTPGAETALRDALAARRALPHGTAQLLREAAARSLPSMDALRMAVGTLSLSTWKDDGEPAAGASEEEGLTLVAAIPTIVAAYHRLLHGLEPIAPASALRHAANFLYMLDRREPSEAQTRAIEGYLATVVDHGLNASTFAARVIVATQSDLISAITGAIGALKGPLHGGAPGPALDMVFEIGTADRAEYVLRRKLENGERLMGFGHRVYKVRDPRADVLSVIAERLYDASGQHEFYALAKHVEETAVRLLEEYKPGRRLQTNVEFYTALLLHGLGLPTSLFTPIFAMARVAGWTAHCFEQQFSGRLIRPQSEYIGERDRTWTRASLRN